MRKQAGIGALLLICVGVVLGATVFRTDIAQATGLAQSVTVNNTTGNPVPVNVTNTAVPVREQNLDGNQNIKVHEQGTANVVNAADGKNTFDDVADEPFGTVFNDVCVQGEFVVPDGKVAVAEYVSGTVEVPAGSVLKDAIFGEEGGRLAGGIAAPIKIGSDGTHDYYVVAQQARIYLHAGTVFGLCIDFVGSISGGRIGLEWSGYLANAS